MNERKIDRKYLEEYIFNELKKSQMFLNFKLPTKTYEDFIKTINKEYKLAKFSKATLLFNKVYDFKKDFENKNPKLIDCFNEYSLNKTQEFIKILYKFKSEFQNT